MSDAEVAEYVKTYKEWVDEDSKIPPAPPPRLDRSRLVANQIRSRSGMEEMSRTRGGAAGKVQFVMSVVGFSKHSSATPLEQLSPSQ